MFQRFEWLWQAWECIARPKGRELLIVVGRIDGRVVLIWPLVRHGKGLVKFLASDRGEYRDVLVEAGAHSEKWIGEAWDALQAGEQINVLHLQDLQAHSLLKKVIEARAPRMRTNLRPAPYIDLKAWPDYEAYFSGLSRNLRQDQTRQLRRLSELGEVRYVVAGDRQAVADTVEWIYRSKLEWQDARGLTNASFRSAEYAHFLRVATLAAFDLGMLHVATLMVGDQIAAAGLGFHDDREFS